jgi:hypothetical protein
MIPNNRMRRYSLSPFKPDPPPDFGRFRRMPRLAYRPLPIPKEARIHALLHDRLTALRRTRRGLWSRFWRFISGIEGVRDEG